jgi:magnesium-protoporphyrin IX monomethyl ester (oxidative) cyclase
MDFFDGKLVIFSLNFLNVHVQPNFGFLLYKEISRNLKKHPLLAEGFSFMSRDEARHAGFLNKAMSDFDVSLDLGFLTKTRKYTFFCSNSFLLYISFRKIGYWRYIVIYHLERIQISVYTNFPIL